MRACRQHNAGPTRVELLTSLGIGDRISHRPNQLSGGQQQRVSIARALMNGGRIVLADEPTGALDSKSGADVMALLSELAAHGHTVILITHDKSVAAHANRIIEIRDGEIVSDSGPEPARVTAALHKEISEHPAAAAISGLGEAMQMAVRALRQNLFRTVLTLLGIMIGVGAVVAMMGIGEGAKQAVVEQIGSMGTNLLLVRPGGHNMRGYSGPIATLTPEDAQAIATLPNISSAVPEITGGATVRLGDVDYQTQVDATTAEYSDVRSWPVESGVFLADSDQTSYAAVAVLGQTVVQNLLPDGGDPIGQYVLINNVPFQVIGVMSTKGANAGGNDSDDVVFIPLSTGMLRIFGQHYVRSITIAVSDLTQMDAVQDSVTALLTARHNGNEDFFVRNMAAILANRHHRAEHADDPARLGRRHFAAGRRHRRDEHHACIGYRTHARDRHPHGDGRAHARYSSAIPDRSHRGLGAGRHRGRAGRGRNRASDRRVRNAN